MDGRGATGGRVVTSGAFEATARRPAVLGAAVAGAGLATFVATPEGTDGTRLEMEMDGRGAGGWAVGARVRDGPARGCTDGRDAVGGTAAVSADALKGRLTVLRLERFDLGAEGETCRESDRLDCDGGIDGRGREGPADGLSAAVEFACARATRLPVLGTSTRPDTEARGLPIMREGGVLGDRESACRPSVTDGVAGGPDSDAKVGNSID
jgi:hypothetical protein